MSVRETPVANRICDLKDKERAYRKHVEAVANAKATIDTSSPALPNRLRAKGVHDMHYRRQIMTDYSRRDKMVNEMSGGMEPTYEGDYPNGEVIEDEDDIDIDALMKRYQEGNDILLGGGAGNNKQNNIYKNDQDLEQKQKVKTENIKFGYTNDPEINYEDDEDGRNKEKESKIPRKGPSNATQASKPTTATSKKSGIPVMSKRSPRPGEKEKLNVKPNQKVGFSPSVKQNQNKKGDDGYGPDHIPKRDSSRPVTPSKSNGRPNTASKTGSRPGTARSSVYNDPESERPGTATSTRTFEDDFDDFESTGKRKDGDPQFVSLYNRDDDDIDNFDEGSYYSDSENEKRRKKVLALAEIDIEKKQALHNTAKSLHLNEDGIPELEPPD